MSNGTSELNRYNIAEPQSEQNNAPNTIASAATIAPVHKFTLITGTTQIANITPPMPGFHVLYLLFTNGSPGTLLTSGNILTAVVPTQNVPCIMFYDPNQQKYYGCANNVT
jgi:hypothetical protein